MPTRKDLTVRPFDDEISFRQLQIKHGHLLEFRDLPTYQDASTQYVKKRSKPKENKQKPKIRIKKKEEKKPKHLDQGQNDVLVNEDPDDYDDVPKYIYTTRKRPVYYDAASLDRKKERAAKQNLKAKRRFVDTMVADYLCNHNYGHVIPVYEGTGLRTCPCCVNRNRENVRSVLGFAADPDNTVQQPIINPWFNKALPGLRKGRLNLYQTGVQRKPALKIDPSFRLSDRATRKNWETSAILEDPDFYDDAIRTYPFNDDGATFNHTFLRPNSHLGLLPNYRDTTKRNNWPISSYSNDKYMFQPKIGLNSSGMYDSRSLISANNKYSQSMNVLRKYTYKY